LCTLAGPGQGFNTQNSLEIWVKFLGVTPIDATDAENIVRTCEGCQFFARKIYLPAQELQTIPLSWLFVV
jgi:hypothetical protein